MQILAGRPHQGIRGTTDRLREVRSYLASTSSPRAVGQAPYLCAFRADDRHPLRCAGGQLADIAVAYVVWTIYVGALHEPKFHDVGLAVVGPPRLVEQLDRSSEFAATSVASRREAIRRIDKRKDLGAIVAGPRTIDVLVAPAAGRAVAIGLRRNLPPALRAATGTMTPVRVIDVKPLPKDDPSGITPFYLALGIVVAALSTRTRPLGLQMQSDRARLEAAREATANVEPGLATRTVAWRMRARLSGVRLIACHAAGHADEPDLRHAGGGPDGLGARDR